MEPENYFVGVRRFFKSARTYFEFQIRNVVSKKSWHGSLLFSDTLLYLKEQDIILYSEVIMLYNMLLQITTTVEEILVHGDFTQGLSFVHPAARITLLIETINDLLYELKTLTDDQRFKIIHDWQCKL